MEKDRKTKVLAVIAVCISIISLTVGFAAFSETLSIGGTAKVEKASWDIHFANLSSVDKSDTAEVSTTPTLEATSLKDFQATLKLPGDYVSYTFDVVNGGSIDAEITTLPNPNPTCTGTATDTSVAQADADKVCNNITYSLTYADGTALQVGDVLNNKNAESGNTKKLKLTLRYNENIQSTDLPTNDVNITDLGLTLIYTQK